MSIQIIRTPHPPDTYLAQIAELLLSEGYPGDEASVQRRLGMLPREDRILMAVEGERLIGFAHLRIARDLAADETAEVVSIVVRPAHRRGGIGRLLVTAAETWARQSGRARLLLRTDVVRTPAHAFYVALGYQKTATTVDFVRDLAVERRADAPTIPPTDTPR
ncbi:MAG: GNAT family N-acetyltransferase [Planctomycetes bacterium]|nr:GNAT family N-acetyltransferase [Planctomycetota bacterium]